jgi:uncharacterized MAPEG superfamily protein
MIWIDLVTTLALLQLLLFGVLVARARNQYGVKAPALTGHAMFERQYRVQMNTLELLVLFVPALYVAARYWPPTWVAGVGSLYLVGRLVYLRAYMRDPAGRALGFGLSAFPIVVLLFASLAGMALAAFR